MEKITTDISSFEKLRRNGFVYVGKADLLWRLVAMRDGSQFVISRGDVGRDLPYAEIRRQLEKGGVCLA